MRTFRQTASTIKISSYPFIDNTFSDMGLKVESLNVEAAYPVIFFVAKATQREEVSPTAEVESQTNEVTRKAIAELRRLSGLTWDQLARLFNVSRRSVHLWVSGKPMNAPNEERLHKVLALLQEVDRGSADENRRLLLTPIDSGESPLDLMAAGQFKTVRQALGSGSGRGQVVHTPLSSSAWEARLPPKPENLVDARHEPVHQDLGVARTARTKRTKG
jgi:DNA-binding transcriptional regulator YiaG